MPEGTLAYKGLALPLNGEYEQKQINLASDMVTLTGVASQTGDFIVCQNSSGTEVFVVSSAGAITAAGELTASAGIAIAASQYINWAGATALTTAPGTGLTKGDMFVAFPSADNPALGVCISTATNAIKYFTAVSSTFGRQT